MHFDDVLYNFVSGIYRSALGSGICSQISERFKKFFVEIADAINSDSHGSAFLQFFL
jgi:hypothetical protein